MTRGLRVVSVNNLQNCSTSSMKPHKLTISCFLAFNKGELVSIGDIDYRS